MVFSFSQAKPSQAKPSQAKPRKGNLPCHCEGDASTEAISSITRLLSRFTPRNDKLPNSFYSSSNERSEESRSILDPNNSSRLGVGTSTLARTVSIFFFVIFLLTLLLFPTFSFAYTTNMSASVVLGQSDFVSNGSGVSSTSMNLPHGSATDGNRLFVPDLANNRVLIWNSIPTRNNTPADIVLGQPDMTSNTANNGGISAATLNQPAYIFTDGAHFIVTDVGNNRVLIWNSIPTQNFQAADVVVGQSSFTGSTSNSGGRSASTLSGSYGILIYKGKLFIADHNNCRVLIYNTIPSTNGVSANVVIGQTNFTSASNSATASGFSCSGGGARGITIYDDKLIAINGSGNRILIYNSIPTTNGASADVVIGQPDFTSTTADNGGITCATLNTPDGVYVTNKGRLFVSERRRVLIFNQIPTNNFQSADIVLGQPDCNTRTSNYGGIGDKTFNAGTRMGFELADKFYVSDASNNRILIFNNLINTPAFGFNGTPTGSTDGKLRMSGNVTVGGGLYNIWKVEASVNGGGYSSVSSLKEGVQNGHAHNPGSTDAVVSSFYHDFEPWSQNNGTQSEWNINQKTMLKDKGYIIELRAWNTNTDLAEHMFYFQPFILTVPKTISISPAITFSVNQYQRTEMKENLDHYEVWVRPAFAKASAGEESFYTYGDWRRYITKIPIDYDTVKEYQDNQRRGDYVDNPGSGNGTYENNDILVSYSKSSSKIFVRKKYPDQDGTTTSSLTPGTYQVKVKAIDKHNHDQDSDPVTVEVKGLSTNKNNLTITTDWFPLQINSISTAQTGILSTNNPNGIKDSYAISNSTPTIKGIAFANTKINLLISDQETSQTRTYEITTKENSTFTFTPTLYQNSLISLFVEDASGKYNELPVFGLNIAQSNNEEVQGVQTEKTTRSISNPSTSLREENPLPTPKPNESPVSSSPPERQKWCVWKWCW